MFKDFVHLHTHTDFSALDATTKIPEAVNKAQQSGMRALAITDHGVAAGSYELWKSTRGTKVKPLIGMEGYLSPTDDHTLREKLEEHPNYYHINLIAKNAQGVKELYQLSSIGFTEGFYYKPRVSLKLIEEIGKNLIVLGACVKGPVNWNLFTENTDRGVYFASRMKESFGRNFYLEVMDHGLEWQPDLNKSILELGQKLDIKVVPTNDAHFLERGDHRIHTLMMCSQLKKSLKELKEADLVYPEECYLKTPEEMKEVFGEELCRKTLEVSEKVDIHLDFSQTLFPNFKRD